MIAIQHFLDAVGVFYILYMIGYASYLFLSVLIGGTRLYRKNRMSKIRNEVKHKYYLPVSILVPAYNEEVTIVSSIKSLLELDYRLYESLWLMMVLQIILQKS